MFAIPGSWRQATRKAYDSDARMSKEKDSFPGKQARRLTESRWPTFRAHMRGCMIRSPKALAMPRQGQSNVSQAKDGGEISRNPSSREASSQECRYKATATCKLCFSPFVAAAQASGGPRTVRVRGTQGTSAKKTGFTANLRPIWLLSMGFCGFIATSIALRNITLRMPSDSSLGNCGATLEEVLWPDSQSQLQGGAVETVFIRDAGRQRPCVCIQVKGVTFWQGARVRNGSKLVRN